MNLATPTFRIARRSARLAKAVAATMSAICIVWAAGALDGEGATAQQPTTASEYNLKLARIYATAKFVAWPDETTAAGTPFVLGVIAPDPFQGGLAKLAGRRLKDRPIQISLIRSPAEYRGCHLLFIPAGAPAELVAEVLARAEGQPVLVFRDQSDVAGSQGVSCTFVREGDKLLTETDPSELKRRHLIPEAQLLSLNIIRLVKPSP